jgi:hypothetical protein
VVRNNAGGAKHTISGRLWAAAAASPTATRDRARSAGDWRGAVESCFLRSDRLTIELTAQVSSSRRCPSSATPRQLIKVGPAKGLDRKQIAPACSARARVVSSGKAVMNMNGTP